MADVDDVLLAVAQLATSTLYPAGPPASGTPSPVANAVCKIAPGWPAAEGLDTDLKAGIVNVTVFMLPGMENVTRYPQDWMPTTPPVHTLTATLSGQTVTIGGTVSIPQNVALIVNGVAYVYSVQAGDTLDSIAQAIADLINGGEGVDQPLLTEGGAPLLTEDGSEILAEQAADCATVNGSAITISCGYRIIARVGGVANSIREVGRVRQRVQTTIWAPTPALRAAAASPIKTAIMALNFLTMPDNFAARLHLVGDVYMDRWEKQLIYRRDLIATVEYATTQTDGETEIIVPQVALSAGQDPNNFVGIFPY